MDEILKIIIATLSGFVVAFFAEPVKIYFQNASKKKSLRLALYNELINNFVCLDSFLDGLDRSSEARVAEAYSKLSALMLKVDVYRFAISQELYLFYQLKEANLFTSTHTIASTIIAWIESGKSEERVLEEAIKYLLLTKSGIEDGDLDKRIIDRIFGKGVTKNLIEILSNKFTPALIIGRWYFTVLDQAWIKSRSERFYITFNQNGTLTHRNTYSAEETTSGVWRQKGSSIHFEIASYSKFDGTIIASTKMTGKVSTKEGDSATWVAIFQS